MSTPGFKILSNIIVPPNGQPTTIVTPTGQGLVITSISVMSLWPDAQRASYHPVHNAVETLGARYVKLLKGGLAYTGFNRNGAGMVKDDRNGNRATPVILTGYINPATGFRQHATMNYQGFSNIGAYSLFNLGVAGTPFTPALDAPVTGENLSLAGPLTLGVGQPLQVTNGIVINIKGSQDPDLAWYTDSTANKATEQTLVSDHRARASHLRVIVYGQEVD